MSSEKKSWRTTWAENRGMWGAIALGAVGLFKMPSTEGFGLLILAFLGFILVELRNRK